MAIPDLQRYSWNLYLINNVEDVVVSLGLKEFDSEFCYSAMRKSLMKRTHNLKLSGFKIKNIAFKLILDQTSLLKVP